VEAVRRRDEVREKQRTEQEAQRRAEAELRAQEDRRMQEVDADDGSSLPTQEDPLRQRWLDTEKRNRDQARKAQKAHIEAAEECLRKAREKLERERRRVATEETEKGKNDTGDAPHQKRTQTQAQTQANTEPILDPNTGAEAQAELERQTRLAEKQRAADERSHKVLEEARARHARAACSGRAAKKAATVSSRHPEHCA